MKKLILFMLVAFILVGAVSALESGNLLEVFAMSQNSEETLSVNNENISVITTDTAPLVILNFSERLIGVETTEKHASPVIECEQLYNTVQILPCDCSRLKITTIAYLRYSS